MGLIAIERGSSSNDKEHQESVRVLSTEQKLLDIENQIKKFLKNAFAKSIQSPFDIARKSLMLDPSFLPKL
jgi:hypothetical protein